MSFATPVFLIFLALASAAYLALPRRLQAPFLLLASLVFYMWALPAYGLLVLATAAAVYFSAFWISGALEKKARRLRLALAISLPLGALLVLKYFNFFSGIFSGIFGLEALSLSPLVQPLGISFYTLQLTGYLVDVYGGEEPERDFVYFALFASFFPYILSGPISRASEMLPQFKEEHRYSYSNAAAGLQRFLCGAFKKLVLADSLGLLVDGVWADELNAAGWPALFAVFFYSLQLYCDFSGYTDMALGAAKVLGFKLRENFLAPYFAFSITDFWSRWHMSLTSWLRDYIYIPLGGNRKGFKRKLLNILIVFAISGLWHGAALTFVVWGLWHALFRLIDELLAKKRGEAYLRPFGLARTLRTGLTFILTSLGWVLFRAPDLSSAVSMVSLIFRRGVSLTDTLTLFNSYAAKGVFTDEKYFAVFWAGIIIAMALALLFDIRLQRAAGASLSYYNPLALFGKRARWALYWLMGLLTAVFYLISTTGAAASSAFIYAGY
ncbi:MAG: MBOAT family O-acyltransferase [Oscillospiraceae bacterium]|nr:MBOAT family O-acyltransferase [Oscillospiraceae bacterium]